MSVPIIQVLKFLCLNVEYVECINVNQRNFLTIYAVIVN